MNEAVAMRSFMIVDDHRCFADLLAGALTADRGLCCVGIAHCAAEAVRVADRVAPDLVVLDVRLGSDDGLQVARGIRARHPDAVIVVVSADADPEMPARAARAGANGYAPKSGSLPELLRILRTATVGSMLIAPSFFHHAAAECPSALIEPLTPRERDVLALMGKGLAPAAIAAALNITLSTCRGYVKNLHLKLGARSQLEAVMTAQRVGLIDAA